jgi:hypothetical protein
MNHAAITAIMQRLHFRIHQGTCADIHPLEHERHMRAFHARAIEIVEAQA